MTELHRVIPKPPAKFYKNLKAALDGIGMPPATYHATDELIEVIRKVRAKSAEARMEERGTLDKQSAYITDAGKMCGRQIWYSFRNEEKTHPTPELTELLFWGGHAYEEAIAKAYAEAEHPWEQEVHVSFERDGVAITGRIDFLRREGNRAVELKVTQADKFKWVIAGKQHGRPEHRTQLNLYLHWLNGEGANVIYDKGELRYVISDAPKGTPPVLSFWVDYDPEQAEKDLARLATIWKMAEAGADPGVPTEYAAEYLSEGKMPLFPCSYCDWRGACWDAMRKGAAA